MRKFCWFLLACTLSYSLTPFCQKSNAGNEGDVIIAIPASASVGTESGTTSVEQDIHELIREFAEGVDLLNAHLHTERQQKATRDLTLRMTGAADHPGYINSASLALGVFGSVFCVHLPLQYLAGVGLGVAYDAAAGCGQSLPASIAGESPVCMGTETSGVLCQPELRGPLIFLSSAVVGYCINKYIVPPTRKLIVEVSDYVLRKAVLAYLNFQDYRNVHDADQTITSFVSKVSSLIARSAELKELSVDYRRLVFKKASEMGLIPLMISLLNESDPSEGAARAELSLLLAEDEDKISLCSICLRCFDGALPLVGPVVKRGCGHVFHEHCISPWADRGGGTCPLCRDSEKPALAGLHEIWSAPATVLEIAPETGASL